MACLKVLDDDLVASFFDGHDDCALNGGGQDGAQTLEGYRDDIMGGVSGSQKQHEGHETRSLLYSFHS